MAGNLTRINNNQITDAVSGNTQFGINANTKVQPYSVTSTLLANNLTYGSDLTITGNLSVTGNVTAIDTTNVTIEDPLLLLASTQTGSPAVDIGYIGQRGTANNVSLVWKESNAAFITAYTSSGAGDNTTINVLSYADFITGNATITGNLNAANISFTGNVIGNLSVTGTLVAGNVESLGYVSSVGNITVGSGSYFIGDGGLISNINAANVSSTKISNGGTYANIASPNGNLEIAVGTSSDVVATFYDQGVNFALNVSAQGTVYASAVGTTADVSAGGNVYGANFTTTGSQGNITGANVISGITLTASGTVYAATDVSAGGNVNSNNVNVTTNVSAGGNVTGNYINAVTDISAQGNVNALGVNAQTLSLSGNVISPLNVSSSVTGQNIFSANDVSAQGNVYAAQNIYAPAGAVNAQTLSLSGNVTSDLNVSGKVTAQYVVAANDVSGLGNVVAQNALNGANLSLSGNVINDLNVSGNVNAGNFTTPGLISVTGTATVGNVSTVGLVSAVGNVIGGNVTSVADVSAGGNVYANNVFANTSVSATGNIVTNQSFVGNALSGNTLIITSTYGGLQFSVTGNINAGNTWITNVPDPVNPTDLANKEYVDGIANGLQLKASSNVATTGNIATTTGQSYTYNNGAAGVGATITFNTPGVVTIDSVELTAGLRVLIKDEPLVAPTDGTTPSAAYNGIYTVTTAGTVGTALVLTRAVDDDVPAQMYSAYTFITSPAGTINSSSGWASTNTPTSPGDPIVVGTTLYIFSQFSQAGVYTGGNAISVTGSTINALYDGSTIGKNGSNQLYIPANAPLTTPNIGDATGNSLSVTGSLTGDIITVATASVTGNILSANITTINISVTGNIQDSVNVSNTVVANNFFATTAVSTAGNITGGNITSANFYDTNVGASQVTYGDSSGNGLISSNNNFTFDGVNLSISGTGGNISATGVVVTNLYDTNVGAGQVTYGDNSGNGLIEGNSNFTFDGVNLSIQGTGGNISATGVVATNLYDTNVGSNQIIFGASTGNGLLEGNSDFTFDGTNVVLQSGGYLSATGAVYGDSFTTSGLTSGGSGFITAAQITNPSSWSGYPAGGYQQLVAAGAASLIPGNIFVDFAGNLSATGTITAANFTTSGSQGNITGANIVSAVTLTASGNVYGDYIVSTLDMLATGNVSAQGNIQTSSFFIGDGSLISNINAANVSYTKISNSGSFANIASPNGNLVIAIGASSNVVATFFDTGTDFNGPVSASGNIVSGTTLLVDTTTSSVSLGANTTETAGATLAINATDSMLLPVGNTAQRPVTPATGMLRYNSTVSQCEIWNGSAWVAVGGSSYTVIENEQFNGDGTTVAFTLASSQTTDSCIVTINGVVQIPTTAYSVSGVYPSCVLTFTEAPEVGDTIDVREITTTTSVTAISNSPGNSVVSVSETVGQVNITGNLVAQLNSGAPSLTANSTMSFQLVNNTTLAILVRGTDGVTRTANITLS